MISMYQKIALLILLSSPLVISADHHAKKGDKSKKEVKKMEMERKGMWKPEDCKKISQTSGAYLYFSGEAFKKRSSLEKDGNQINGYKGGTATSNDGSTISAKNFYYNKLTNILETFGNVKYFDKTKNIYCYFLDQPARYFTHVLHKL